MTRTAADGSGSEEAGLGTEVVGRADMEHLGVVLLLAGEGVAASDGLQGSIVWCSDEQVVRLAQRQDLVLVVAHSQMVVELVWRCPTPV